MDSINRLEEFPGNEFFAKIESVMAVQDYGDSLLCVRLIGVSRASFDSASFNDRGCETYVIDIALEAFSGFVKSWYRFHNYAEETLTFHLKRRFPRLENGADWFHVKFSKVGIGDSNSYAYSAFRGDEPTYLGIHSIRPQKSGPAVNPPPAVLPEHFFENEADDAPASLTAFHVGQGMCSLLTGPNVGYLFDAGAGTPIKRLSYQIGQSRSGATLINHLKADCADKKLVAVISHPDADHWRLLEWDFPLASQVKDIFIPAGTSILAFSSPVTKLKVKGLNSKSIKFTNQCQIDIVRSKPAPMVRNTDGLIVQVSINNKVALIPGDYVYKEMLNDTTAINAIPIGTFDAVVVPHHGDLASAANIPAAKTPDQSIAFFSAGDHQGYGHPTVLSENNHAAGGYIVVKDKYCEHIIRQHLLP